MIFETNLRLLQEWASDSTKVILGRFDKSLTPSVSFIAISPNLLVGSSTISGSDFKDRTHFFGEVDPSILEQAFTLFREKLGEYEKEVGEDQHPPLKGPLNWHDHPLLKGIAIGYALQDTFNEADTSGDNIYFVDRAVWREQDQHFLCPILQVNRRAYESHYRLKMPVTLNTSSTSLLDLTINQILQACFVGLRSTNGEEIYAFTSYARNILTDSARAMMTFGQPTNFDLFGDCNAVAALPYESKGSRGRIILALKGHPNIATETIFKSPVRSSDHRMMRKVLEMSQGELSLFCDGIQIYGLGAITGNYDHNREDLFVVEFTKQNTWRLWHDQHEMMVVINGKPGLPAKQISEEKFKEHFRRCIPYCEESHLESIYRATDAAADQGHGALLVISDKAEDEAARLGGQVKPCPLTISNVPAFTAIDGAVLIDPSGMCHGVGVILDGQATVSWDASRGSRYNSALRYVWTKRKEGHQCLAVVISEDGMINLL